MNIRKCFIVAAIAIAGLVGQGCTQAQLDDWADCGRASVGVGWGLEVHSRLGCVSQPAIGYARESWRIGHENCRVTGVWKETHLVWPEASVMPDALSILVDPFPGHGNWTSVKMFEQATDKRYAYRCGFWLAADAPPYYLFEFVKVKPFAFRELTDFEIGGTLGAVSVRVGINPLEIADLALSVFGLDIADDDTRDQQAVDIRADDALAEAFAKTMLLIIVEGQGGLKRELTDEDREKIRRGLAELRRSGRALDSLLKAARTQPSSD